MEKLKGESLVKRKTFRKKSHSAEKNQRGMDLETKDIQSTAGIETTAVRLGSAHPNYWLREQIMLRIVPFADIQ